MSTFNSTEKLSSWKIPDHVPGSEDDSSSVSNCASASSEKDELTPTFVESEDTQAAADTVHEARFKLRKSKQQVTHFLNSHRFEAAEDGSVRAITHTSMTGGKYMISPDNIDMFEKLYCDYLNALVKVLKEYVCLTDDEKLYLVERPTKNMFFFVDLDFKAKVDSADVESCIDLIVSILSEISEPVYITTRNGNYHINTSQTIEYAEHCMSVRDVIVKKLKDEYPTHDWESIVDKSVYVSGLKLIGSFKPGQDTTYLPTDTNSEITPDILKQYLIRNNSDSHWNVSSKREGRSNSSSMPISGSDRQVSEVLQNVFAKDLERQFSVGQIVIQDSKVIKIDLNPGELCPYHEKAHKRNRQYVVIDPELAHATLKCYDSDCFARQTERPLRRAIPEPQKNTLRLALNISSPQHCLFDDCSEDARALEPARTDESTPVSLREHLGSKFNLFFEFDLRDPRLKRMKAGVISSCSIRLIQVTTDAVEYAFARNINSDNIRVLGFREKGSEYTERIRVVFSSIVVTADLAVIVRSVLIDRLLKTNGDLQFLGILSCETLIDDSVYHLPFVQGVSSSKEVDSFYLNVIDMKRKVFGDVSKDFLNNVSVQTSSESVSKFKLGTREKRSVMTRLENIRKAVTNSDNEAINTFCRKYDLKVGTDVYLQRVDSSKQTQSFGTLADTKMCISGSHQLEDFIIRNYISLRSCCVNIAVPSISEVHFCFNSISNENIFFKKFFKKKE